MAKKKQGRRPKTAKKARIVSSKTVYRGPVFQVTCDQVVEPSGVKARRDTVRHSGSVVILAVDERRGAEPRVLLARQYRHPAQRFLWELPAGRIDEGENPLAAAKRELREETGYAAERWKRALYYWASPGFLDETMAVYYAAGLRRGRAEPEEDESIAIRMFPLSGLLRMIERGTIQDGKTIAGAYWLAASGSGKGSRSRRS